jgi:hypothetical protein
MARVADHRDLELGRADSQTLPHRPAHDVGAAHGEVLLDRARLDADGVEVLGCDEEDGALAVP